MMQYLSACPICQGMNFQAHLSVKDHTVSHETFVLEKCHTCGFVLTNPRPDHTQLPRYYESQTYISHSNKSATVVDHLYKISRKFTLRWKYDLIHRHSLIKPVAILDFGCGTGGFLRECQKNKMNVTGVEPSSIARATAIKDTKAPIHPDISSLREPFDVITLWHVLEHVPDLHETLRNLKDLLNQSGTMFIAVPNLKSRDAETYQEHWAGYDVPRHLWHFSKTTMKRALEYHELKLVTTIPMRLDSYYVSLLSEKYRNQQNPFLNMVRAVCNGWRSNQSARNTHEYSSLIYVVRK